jgi:hypothetical protein
MGKISAGPFELLNGLVEGFQAGSKLAMQQQEMAMKRQAMDFDQSMKTKMQELEQIKTNAQISVWETEIKQKQREDFVPEDFAISLFFDDADAGGPVADPSSQITPQSLTSLQSTVDTLSGVTGSLASPGAKPAAGEIQKGGAQLNQPIESKVAPSKQTRPPIMRSINSIDGQEQEIVDSTGASRDPSSIMQAPKSEEYKVRSDDEKMMDLKRKKIEGVLGPVKEHEGGRGWFLGKGTRDLLEKRMGSIAAGKAATAKGLGDSGVSAKDIMQMAAKQAEFGKTFDYNKYKDTKQFNYQVSEEIKNDKIKSVDIIHGDYKKKSEELRSGMNIAKQFLTIVSDKDGNRRSFEDIISDKRSKNVYLTSAKTLMKAIDDGKMSDKDAMLLEDATKGNRDKLEEDLRSWISTGRPLKRDTFNALNDFMDLKYNSDLEIFKELKTTTMDRLKAEEKATRNPYFQEVLNSKFKSVYRDLESGQPKEFKNDEKLGAPKKTASSKVKATPAKAAASPTSPDSKKQTVRRVKRVKGYTDDQIIELAKKQHKLGPNDVIKVVD